MRIALVNPTYWPEVRRGTERVIHDAAHSLASRGHEVSILASHPGRPRSFDEAPGVSVTLDWRPPAVGPLAWYEDHLADSPRVGLRLVSGRYDVAHVFHPATCWAAVRARALGGPPVVASLHGIPQRKHLVSRRYRLEMTSESFRAADVATVLSEAAAAAARRYLLLDPVVLPGGVVSSDFDVQVEKRRATLVCAASLGDPRKRGDVLLQAFEELRSRREDVELVLVKTPDPHLSPEQHTLPAGVRMIDADDTNRLAEAYASASASVLPSIDEAFGLVLIESLAAGTPVVATKSGACPEIVDSAQIGVLVEPDDSAALARGMESALELAKHPSTSDACRERARQFDWSRVAEQHERLYHAALESGNT